MVQNHVGLLPVSASSLSAFCMSAHSFVCSLLFFSVPHSTGLAKFACKYLTRVFFFFFALHPFIFHNTHTVREVDFLTSISLHFLLLLYYSELNHGKWCNLLLWKWEVYIFVHVKLGLPSITFLWFFSVVSASFFPLPPSSHFNCVMLTLSVSLVYFWPVFCSLKTHHPPLPKGGFPS